MTWHIIGILAFVVIYNIWRYYHKDDNYADCPVDTTTSSMNQASEKVMEEKISTRQLALKAIENIGSEPQYTEEGRIQFEYQGITFLMEAANDCDYINLIWPWCYSFNKFDIDEFARVRQVANDINAYGVVSVFYGVTDSDDVAVHVKNNFLFIQQIPDIEKYLRMMLEDFFRAIRKLDLEIEKLKMQECERQV